MKLYEGFSLIFTEGHKLQDVGWIVSKQADDFRLFSRSQSTTESLLQDLDSFVILRHLRGKPLLARDNVLEDIDQ